MKRALGLTAGAAAATLLLSGTGATTAAWRDGAVLDTGTITTGSLDVAVARVDDTSVAATRRFHRDFAFKVSAQVDGNNLASELRIRFDENRDFDGSEVMTAAFIQVDDTGLMVDAHGGELVVGVVPEGGAWPGGSDVPVFAADNDGTVHVPITFVVTQMDRAVPKFLFPGGDLVTSLHQYRPGIVSEDSAGLWSDEDSAKVPAISDDSVSTLATEPVTPESDDDQGHRESEDVPAREKETPHEESTDDEESSSDQLPTVDETPASPETSATDETPNSQGEASDRAPEPDWVRDLLTVMEEAGMHADTIDPTELPAEIEEWATEHAIPVDDIVAWLERRTS